MIYYINAYKPDTETLKLCVKQVRTLDSEAQFFVANDPQNPVVDFPAGVTQVVANFPRGGNLRGTHCVIGQLNAMLEVLKKTNEKYIVKLDCDTWLNSVDWLKEGCWVDELGAEPDLIVQERGEPFSISGDCYRLSRLAVETCIEKLQERIDDSAMFGVKWEDMPEDVTTCHLCSYNQLLCKHIPYYLGKHVGMHNDLPKKRNLDAWAVHCGEPTIDGRRASRDFVLLRMRLMEAAKAAQEQD